MQESINRPGQPNESMHQRGSVPDAARDCPHQSKQKYPIPDRANVLSGLYLLDVSIPPDSP